MPLCLTVCLRIKYFQNKNTAQIELLIDIGNRIASYDFDVLTYTNYSEWNVGWDEGTLWASGAVWGGEYNLLFKEVVGYLRGISC